MQGHVHLLKMAANDVGRSESVPKRPRISSVHSETTDLRQRLESSFPLDALLPALHDENVLTDYEFKQLLPTPQTAVVERNRNFLEYLANKDPSATEKTLSILYRHECESYGYFGEMLRQLSHRYTHTLSCCSIMRTRMDHTQCQFLKLEWRRVCPHAY